MDLEQLAQEVEGIKSSLSELSGLKDSLKTLPELQKTVAQLTDLATKPKEPEKPKEDPEKLTLSKRLEILEQQIKERDEALAAKNFSEALGKAVDSHNPAMKTLALEVLQGRLKDFQATDGRYLNKEGQDLDSAVKAFFESPEGKHLLPPKHSEGAGVKETKERSVTPEGDLGSQLMNAFM